MSINAYELLALCMRYVFAALMVLIVIRSWRITFIDGQRATKLRRLSPETGIIGEFLVIEGDQRSRTGMRYPVTLEGTIGSGKRCDIRLRSNSVRSRHVIFQMTSDGLYIRSHGHAHIRDGFGRTFRQLTLNDGDYISIGSVRLMLVLSGVSGHVEESERHHKSAPSAAPSVAPGISRNSSDPYEVSDTAPPRPARRPAPGVQRSRPQQRRPYPRPRYGYENNDTDFDPFASFDENIQSAEDDYSDDSGADTPAEDTYEDVFYDFDEYDDC